MIVITVGLEKYPFNRLLRNMDEWVGNQSIREPVFAQIGHSTYLPRHLEYCRFLPFDEMRKQIQKADRVICHAGVGTILLSLRLGRHPLVIPRHAEFGEQVDDHQLDLCTRLCESDQITVVDPPHTLLAHLQKPVSEQPLSVPVPAPPAQLRLESFLNETLRECRGI